MIKACIFDLDGTLADTLESMAVSTNKVLKPLGYGPLPTENFRYYAGDGARMLVQRALTDAGDRKLVIWIRLMRLTVKFSAKTVPIR